VAGNIKEERNASANARRSEAEGDDATDDAVIVAQRHQGEERGGFGAVLAQEEGGKIVEAPALLEGGEKEVGT
jgi:hypothetical protein